MTPEEMVREVRASSDDDFGDLSIGFVNTRAVGRSGLVDVLDDPRAFTLWLLGVGSPGCPALLPTTLPGRRILLGEARYLRQMIERAFRDVATGRPVAPRAVHSLNRIMALTVAVPGLRVVGGGVRLSVTHVSDRPAAALSPVARAAAALLTTVDPSRLRACGAGECPRWFVDTSRGGRRRWCSMATCGNRAKAARFRRRHGMAAS